MDISQRTQYEVTRSLYHVSAAADSTQRLMHFLHPAMLALALGAGVFGWRRVFSSAISDVSQRPWPIIATLAYFTLLYTVFAPWPRYSIPLRPELYLLAVWGIEQLVKKMSSNGR